MNNNCNNNNNNNVNARLLDNCLYVKFSHWSKCFGLDYNGIVCKLYSLGITEIDERLEANIRYAIQTVNN